MHTFDWYSLRQFLDRLLRIGFSVCHYRFAKVLKTQGTLEKLPISMLIKRKEFNFKMLIHHMNMPCAIKNTTSIM